MHTDRELFVLRMDFGARLESGAAWRAGRYWQTLAIGRMRGCIKIQPRWLDAK